MLNYAEDKRFNSYISTATLLKAGTCNLIFSNYCFTLIIEILIYFRILENNFIENL